MARELRSGDLRRVLRSVHDAGHDFAPRALTEIGQQTERAAKDNANTGTHRRGQRTTAVHGAGPNVVSGNLRRNITHTVPAKDAHGWFTRVGVANTAVYGKWVEIKNNYPFLLPAAKTIAARAKAIVKPLWRSPRV